MAQDLRRTALLSAIIFVALLVNNVEYIFGTELYEQFDAAANSLRVLRAKEFKETVGHYSRFGFNHPGPVLFYLYAFGEAVFYDWLRLVPTPFNAQKIPLFAVTSLFLGSTVAIAAAHMEKSARRLFVPLALLFGAIHFAAAGRAYAFIPVDNGILSSWPGCTVVAPFACFLVAAASVATGKARHLPWLVIAACFLVHGHVAMPLFVVPLTILAYALMTRRLRAQMRLWPWQAFGKQHYAAGAMIALFLLPIGINSAGETPSNLALIAKHVANESERKPLLHSLLYFLQFGAYAPSGLQGHIPLYDPTHGGEVAQYFRARAVTYAAWLVITTIALLPLVSRRGAVPSTAASIAAGRFLNAMGLLLGVAIALTLVWGCLQTGEMYYFNAFFNFAIYYLIALTSVAVAALWTAARLAHCDARTSDWGIRWTSVVLAGAALFTFVWQSDGWRPRPVDVGAQQTFIRGVKEALAEDPAPEVEKIVVFDAEGGLYILGVALQLERHRRSFRVDSEFPVARVIFDRERVLSRDLEHSHAHSRLVWRVIKDGSAASAFAAEHAQVRPLLDGYILATPIPHQGHLKPAE